jgi:DNA repair protein RadA/Sms
VAKRSSHFVCQNCGSAFPKWAGRCENCGAWNSLVEEAMPAAPPKGLGAAKRGKGVDLVALKGQSQPLPRRLTQIAEFDRVTGGGLVPGAAVLIGGDPGIGKSTLLLQAMCRLASKFKCLYISGEEALDQVRMRAERLGLIDAPVTLASATNVREIVATLEAEELDIVVADSVQTLFVDTLDSAPGTVAQVRASSQELIAVAKRRGFSLLLVGHVTKEGTLAGPRVLEHMVDAVLYFEGERGHQFRILRAVKNRFGPTDEIGVFEMTDRGLAEVPNPSALFLAQRRDDVSGSAVFAGIEGTRPVLTEIQALIGPPALGTPRRAVIGWDSSRLAMLLAVLETRCGLQLAGNDVYLNVAGGLRITEPAADLAVAAALVSALFGVPAPQACVFFGEVGLSGEVRMVGQQEARLKEAAKLGFTRAIVPVRSAGGQDKPRRIEGLSIDSVGALSAMIETLRESAPRRPLRTEAS